MIVAYWKGQVFVDCALSFGLKSACKIFTAQADAVEWVTSQKGAHGIISWGALSSRDCAERLGILLEVWLELGMSVASQKCQGPTTLLVFLGIEYDSMSMGVEVTRRKVRPPAGPRH